MRNSPALRRQAGLLDPEIRETRQFAALADAKNTQLAYLSDWKHFLSWCKKRNKSPLPAEPDDIAMYLRYCAETLKLNMSTVKRRTGSITVTHKRNSSLPAVSGS